MKTIVDYLPPTVSHSPKPLGTVRLSFGQFCIANCALAAIALMYIASLSSGSILDASGARLVNVLGPCILGIVACLVARLVVRQNTSLLLSPIAMFLFSVTIFFGFGPLVHVFGSHETLKGISSGPFALSDRELVRTNLLNCVGLISVLVGVFCVSRTRPSLLLLVDAVSGRPVVSPAVVATIFLIVGGSAYYLLWLPYTFGLSDIVVPGALSGVVGMFSLGLAIASYLSHKGHRYWTIVLWVLWPLHTAVQVLEFAKAAVILGIALPILGGYLANSSVRRLLVGGALVVLAYANLQSLVHFGRSQIVRKTGTIYRATLSYRLEIVNKYFFEEDTSGSVRKMANSQGAWTRLSYAGSQAAVMRRFDAGLPIDHLKNAWILFIPRLFWRDKPIVSPATDAYRILTKHSGSALGVTLFGDAYWHFGWIGVVVAGGVIGATATVLSNQTMVWIASKNLLFFPAILLSMKIAMIGNTEALLSTFGSLIIYSAYVVATCMLCLVISRVGGKVRLAALSTQIRPAT